LSAEFSVADDVEVAHGELLFDSLDVSEGGAFLRSDLLLDRDDEIWVTFRLPHQDGPIRARARVAWVTPLPGVKGAPGMGIEFVDLPKAARDAIVAFVSTRP
jgi:uncharacterized protein (TIGR02266 family)